MSMMLHSPGIINDNLMKQALEERAPPIINWAKEFSHSWILNYSCSISKCFSINYELHCSYLWMETNQKSWIKYNKKKSSSNDNNRNDLITVQYLCSVSMVNNWFLIFELQSLVSVCSHVVEELPLPHTQTQKEKCRIITRLIVHSMTVSGRKTDSWMFYLLPVLWLITVITENSRIKWRLSLDKTFAKILRPTFIFSWGFMTTSQTQDKNLSQTRHQMVLWHLLFFSLLKYI